MRKNFYTVLVFFIVIHTFSISILADDIDILPDTPIERKITVVENEITSVNISVSNINGGKSITMSAEDYIETKTIIVTGLMDAAGTQQGEDNINNHIYYTLDGSDPYGGEHYTGAIEITEEGTYEIKAVADYSKSSKGAKHEIASETVVVEQADMPDINIEYDDETSAIVSLESEISGAKIYYTTDGSAPTEESKQYKKMKCQIFKTAVNMGKIRVIYILKKSYSHIFPTLVFI